MKPFAAKLFPPRPTFHEDITQAEMDIMTRHGAYWRALLEKKIAVAFGAVVADAANAIIAEDPAFKAGYRFEAYPMMGLVH